jgi:hypothetical protein
MKLLKKAGVLIYFRPCLRLFCNLTYKEVVKVTFVFYTVIVLKNVNSVPRVSRVWETVFSRARHKTRSVL